MGFGRDHKFYTGLESLRNANLARARLGEVDAVGAVDTTPLSRLDPIPETLYPLLFEMQRKMGDNPVVFAEDRAPADVKYDSVEKYDQIYTEEVRAEVATGKTVQQFLRDEKKKNKRSGRVDPTMESRRKFKEYPTMSRKLALAIIAHEASEEARAAALAAATL
jgi:hypothetical protein